MPLRDRCLVLEPPRPRRRVPAQLPRDRRRAAIQPPRDLPHTKTLSAEERDLLPLDERQVAARHRWRKTGIHAASVAEPPERHRRRHTRLARRVLGLQPTSDRGPEPDPILTPRHRRPPRRGHLPPIQLNLPLPLPHRPHPTPPPSRCCDDQLNPPCDAVVGVDHACRGRLAVLDRHPERVARQRRGRVVADRPADDAAAERVEHDGAVDLALPGRVLGDVGQPQLVRAACGGTGGRRGPRRSPCPGRLSTCGRRSDPRSRPAASASRPRCARPGCRGRASARRTPAWRRSCRTRRRAPRGSRSVSHACRTARGDSGRSRQA